jgi:hypothetical protein
MIFPVDCVFDVNDLATPRLGSARSQGQSGFLMPGSLWSPFM